MLFSKTFIKGKGRGHFRKQREQESTRGLKIRSREDLSAIKVQRLDYTQRCEGEICITS